MDFKRSLIEFAKDVKINNIEQFTSCLDSHKYSQIVMKNDIFGKEIGLGIDPYLFFLKAKFNQSQLLYKDFILILYLKM